MWPELLLVATLHELPADLVDAFPEGLVTWNHGYLGILGENVSRMFE